MSAGADTIILPTARPRSRLDPFGAYLARCDLKNASDGPPAGLEIAVKDNISVEGLPFTAGLGCFAGRFGVADASIISLLRKAGGIVNGVTVTDSGGLGVLTPQVKNPVFPGRTVGGSSGGAAAAVAAGLADIGIGTDTAGSVRIPAACCGLFGFKPSRGLISADGVWPLAPSFDAIGVMTANSAHLKAVLEVLLNWQPLPARAAGLRLGLDVKRLHSCDEAVVTVIEDTCRKMPNDRVELHAIDLPKREDVFQAHSAIVLSNALKLYAPILKVTPHLLPDTVLRALRAAQLLTKDEIAKSITFIENVQLQMETLLGELDAVIAPTLPCLPPPIGRRRIAVRHIELPAAAAMTSETSLANILGAPAFSIPCGSDHARFVSLQCIGLRGNDAGIFGIGDQIASFIGAAGCFGASETTVGPK